MSTLFRQIKIRDCGECFMENYHPNAMLGLQLRNAKNNTTIEPITADLLSNRDIRKILQKHGRAYLRELLKNQRKQNLSLD